MKKLVLIAAGLGLTLAAFAQKSQIRTANNYLGEQNYEKAKAAIEEAVTSDDTKDDPYAWFVRGMVYLTMQQQPANEGKELYNEAGKSFKKAIALQSDYKKEDVNNKLFAVAIYNYNTALGAYDKQDWNKAYQSFGEVVDIANLEDGKRFSGKNWLKFDTMAHQSSLYQGYAAYYGQRYDDALPLLVKAKNDPIAKAYNIYLMLADIYESKKDDANLMATLAEGKKEFPDEKAIANRELNMYIKAGKSEELVSKLQEAIKGDPNNPDLLFTLAVAYDNMANPKDAKGNDLAKPTNYAELFTKAEDAYKSALQAADKPEVNYNMGALYFNRAVVINEQMNAITGTSTDELKKYDGLKAQREEWFNKALPYFEKVVTVYDPQAASLKGEDKNTYMSAIVAAKEIYAKQNKLEKASDYKKKLEAVNK
jgi:Tfp pilus assembly protein PilF